MATKKTTTTKTTSTRKKKELTFEQRVHATYGKEIKLYEKAKISKQPYINFGNRPRVPLLARFGMFLIKKCGGVFDTKFVDLNK